MEKDLIINFQKFFTREISLFVMEYWHKGEYYSLDKNLAGATHFNPLFIRNQGIVGVYYDTNNDKTAVYPLIEYIIYNPKLFYDLADKYETNYLKLVELSKEPSIDNLDDLFELLTDIAGFLPIVMRMGDMQNTAIEKSLTGRAYDLRSKTQEKDFIAEKYFKSLVQEFYPELIEYWSVIGYRELKDGKIPSIDELENRKKHLVYFEGRVISDLNDLEFSKKFNLKLVEELGTIGEISVEYGDNGINTGAIKGAVAFAGLVSGTVVLIKNKNDILKVEDGDILVSNMTTPDFIFAMKKAAAFITDEGGITSHVAITARELKKPCIIGTKIATQVLKDGDFVEVDANNGVVTVIK